MTERYRILDHPADGKFRAFGATMEEAFANAALATASLMVDWENVERRVEHPVRIEAGDLQQLLNKFLSEMIYLFDAKKFVLGAAEDVRIEMPPEKGTRADGPIRLSARFVGDDRPERYEFHGDVKAVTYSEMKIDACDCGPGPWVLQVVVDM
ncbi:MAG: archease [Candidatus Aminicenantales bacterium]|jgi:SHS2 domain-containing protein